ncbi:cytochrome P450 [Apiospora hydei]|uniref:Cytochrome P450 n=1 Tax=Apiospora hydei TaxID=1337664 RepID=A0ABR1V4W6_9PEZI
MQNGLLVVLAATPVWILGVCLYRLYFSPLAKFPGPKLAALTGWVETYYDVYKGGQFFFKLKEWHAHYGPIVRINPWEVHISDPDAADIVFAGNSQFNKKIEWSYRFGIPQSAFDTVDHHLHKSRRAALSPFFSKQKIAGIADLIANRAQRLCDRLDNEYKHSGKPVIMDNAFTAYTFDLITTYVFARSDDYLEHPTFCGPFTTAAKSIANTVHMTGHFPWLFTFLQSLPKKWLAASNPHMGEMFTFHEAVENQVKVIKSGDNDAHKHVSHKTVFNELINSNLPAEEKTVERLRQEGVSVVTGGIETTSTALTKTLFYILNNPAVRDRVCAELQTVFPGPRQTPPLHVLESLPYLSAVINESLRMILGFSQRIIRTSPRAPVVYKDWVIPPGAYFSMTIYFSNFDAQIWEAPHEFRPERWLDDESGRKPRALNGEPLAKYLLTFGRGPRMCVGMNLARAEIIIGLAVVLRRCNMELFETGMEAVEMKSDYFIPMVDKESNGVRVIVK